ncbi:MAG: cupin domain-containing protein [Candidatus Helarchaeota archaeon]|nr:cupin domain-containing protein [Candidatus Helarchaeota archaeon]
MIFKLKEKCDAASKREFFYGALINHDIQDVYIGLGFLEPEESNRKTGPGKGHEEIIYLMDGQMKAKLEDEEMIMNEGDAIFVPDGHKVLLTNLTKKKIYFVVAGGHTVRHSHHGH